MSQSASVPACVPDIFEFGDDRIPVRVFSSESGDTLWHASDVCNAIGIKNPRDAVARLDPDEKDVADTDTLGGRQSVTVVTEPGLYKLVMTSRQDRAKAFTRWITHEVLPSIRRRGRYDVAQADPEIEARLDSDPMVQSLRAILDLRRDQLVLERQQRELVASVAESQAKADKALGLAEATAATVAGHTGHISALGYANRCGYKIARPKLAVIGRKMCAAARSRGVELPDTGDERYGTVKVYPESFVREFDADFRREAGLGG